MNNQLFYDAILYGDDFGKKLTQGNQYNNKYWFDLGMNNPNSFTVDKTDTKKKSVYYFCPLILDTTSGDGQTLLTFLQNSLNTNGNFYFNEKGNIQFTTQNGKNIKINNPISPLGPDETFADQDSWDWMLHKSGNAGMRSYLVDFSKAGGMITNLYLSYLLYYDGTHIRLLYNPIHREDFYKYTQLKTNQDTIQNVQDLLQNYAESVVTKSTQSSEANKLGTIFADPTCNCWYQNYKYSNSAGWQGDSALPNTLLNGENMYDYGTYMGTVSSDETGAFYIAGKRREYCLAPACFWTIPGKTSAWGTIKDNWTNCETMDPINVPLCMGGIYNLMNKDKNIGATEACPENIVNQICTNNILNEGGNINIGTNNSTCKSAGGNPTKDQRKSCLNGICVDDPTGNYQNSTECSSKCISDKKGVYTCDKDSGKCSKVAEGQGYTNDADKCASDCSNFGASKKNHTVLIIIITLIILLIIGVSAFFIVKKIKNKK